MTLRSFLLRLCIFISVELVIFSAPPPPPNGGPTPPPPAPLRVTRMAGGDEFPNSQHPTVICNNPEGTVTPGTNTCKCNNKDSLFITDKAIRCQTYTEIKTSYVQNYNEFNVSSSEGTPITELTLSSSTNEIGITQWDTLKTLTQIYIKGKLMDSTSCSVPPTVKEVLCNLDKDVWVICLDIGPGDFVMRPVPSVVNVPDLYKLQIIPDTVSTKSDFAGQLLALNIVCNSSGTNNLNGYLIFKVQGIRSYELPTQLTASAPPPPPPNTPTLTPVATPVPTVSQSTDSSEDSPDDSDSDEGDFITIQRQSAFDTWFVKETEKKNCPAASSYMVDQNKAKGCFSKTKIASEFNERIVLLNNQPVFHFSFNDDTDKWRNPKSERLYLSTQMKVVSSLCSNPSITKYQVYNYNIWQDWALTGAYFSLKTHSDGFGVEMNNDYTSNHDAFLGQLFRIRLKCEKDADPYNLFVKFAGTYKYSKNFVKISPPSPITSTPPEKLSDDNIAIILGGVLGGLGLILGLIAIACFILYQRRRRRRRGSVRLPPPKEKETKTKLSKFGKDDKVVMSKADIIELAEQILQERNNMPPQDSPRYTSGQNRPHVDPRPGIGPLSEGYIPTEDNDSNNSGLYDKIPEPQYEGLYLKPQEDKYIQANAVIHKPSPAPSKKSVKSAYEVEDEYS